MSAEPAGVSMVAASNEASTARLRFLMTCLPDGLGLAIRLVLRAAGFNGSPRHGSSGLRRELARWEQPVGKLAARRGLAEIALEREHQHRKIDAIARWHQHDRGAGPRRAGGE